MSHHDKPNLARHDVYVCNECGKTQPCPTIRAIEAERTLARSRECQVQMYEGEEILVRRRDGQGWTLPKKHTYHWVSATEVSR